MSSYFFKDPYFTMQSRTACVRNDLQCTRFLTVPCEQGVVTGTKETG